MIGIKIKSKIIWTKKNAISLNRICQHSYYFLLNPLSARIFTVFELLVIRGQSITQGTIGTLLGVQVYKKVKFP